MAIKYTVSQAVTAEEKKAESAKPDPQAYIFIGRQEFNGENGAAMRKRFLVFSRMFRDGAGNAVTQNVFGLTIVTDFLNDFEAAAKKALGKDYDKVVKTHWDAILAEEKKAADLKAAREKATEKETAKKKN